MANWREKLNIKAILEKYSDVDTFDPVTDEMRKDYTDLINGSKFLRQKGTLLEKLKRCHSVNDLNVWMEELYNEADRCLVWMGAM